MVRSTKINTEQREENENIDHEGTRKETKELT